MSKSKKAPRKRSETKKAPSAKSLMKLAPKTGIRAGRLESAKKYEQDEK